MHELAELASWVREQAVPRLVTGEDPSPKRIPARYEIRAAHADERGAIARGSLITAAERTKLRLGATSARRNLVDLLLPLSTGLTRGGLELWLENASDAEVVDWASQLKESLLDGPTKTQDILDRLVDDASRHLDPGPGRSEAG